MRKLYVLVLALCAGVALNAQTANSYVFSQSTTTYTPIAGTDLVSGTGWDDEVQSLPIPFSFTYAGTAYSSCNVSTNGFVTFGTPVPGTTNYTPLSSSAGYPGAVSALGFDLINNGAAITYITTGSAPNRVFVVQWNNARRYSGGGVAGDNFNFQIRLYEGTNVAEIAYGTCGATSTAALGVQVGLRGASNADYNNRTSTTSWTATTAGTAATATVSTSPTILPPSGLTFTYTPPSICSGRPSAGTISGPSSACNGVSFALTSTGVTTGSGIRYAWQSSPDNATWTNIAGQTSGVSATVSQTGPTFYRLVDTCTASGLTAISNVLQVTANAPSTCYCTPVYSNGCGFSDLITSFTLNTLTNNSGTTCQTTAPLGYTVYPSGSFTTTLTAGTSYSASVTIGSGGAAGVAIWIDYNDNGIFEASEKSATPSTIAASGTATIPVSVPANAAVGSHRMRVRLVFSATGTAIDACASASYGEAEDYTIDVAGSSPCTGTPGGGTSSANTNIVCGSQKIYLTNTGSGPGGNLTYQWQTSTDNINFTDLPGVISTTDSTTVSSNSFLRLRVTCTASGLTAFSNTIAVTVSAVPANDECATAITISTTPFGATCSSSTSVNTFCATTSTNTSGGWFTSQNDDVWYRFVATNAAVTVNVSNFVATRGTATALAYVIYNDSTNCANVNTAHELTTAYPTITFTGGNGSSTFTGLVVGNTYTLRLFTSGAANAASFSFCLQEPPAPPSSCATNLFPANGATGVATPVTFSWTAVPNATSYTLFLGVNNPPTAADSITTVPGTSVQIVGGAANTTLYWYVVPKNAGGSAPGCVSNVTSFTTATPPANDQCSNAVSLTIGNGFCTNPVLGTLAFADSTSGLGVASCASSALKNDVWYTVTVQPGRKAIVQTSAMNTTVTDLVIQAYTGTCGALITKACDDDGNPEPGPSAAHSRLLLTNTGTIDSTYYIRVMPYNSTTNSGAFGICAWDSSAAQLPVIAPGTTNACAPGTGVTIDSISANLYMWVPLFDGSGRVIGEIYPNGNVLGSTATSVYVNNGTVRQYNGQYYLDRNITITPANQPAAANKVKLRLYFTAAELAAFQTVVPAATRANMVATKINTTCAGVYTPVQPVIERAAANSAYRTTDNYIQLDTISAFSTFFLHLSAANAPLPANILTFSGSRQGTTNNLKWVVAQEQDVQTYGVERSNDGRNWTTVGSVASLGATSVQRTYTFADNSFSSLKQQYRLRQVDYNGGVKVSTIVIISGVKPTTLTLNGLFPNPALHSINLLVDAPVKDNITIVVMDAVGKIVKTQRATVESGSNTLQVPISALAAGSYLVRVTCASNCASAVSKFVKE